jgi:hypothetical protein
MERQKPSMERHSNALEVYFSQDGGSPIRAREEKYTGIKPGGMRRYIDNKYAERRRRFYEFDIECEEDGVAESESEGVGVSAGGFSPIKTKHEWKAEFEGDVGAFSYPSLQEETGKKSDFTVKWKLADTAVPVEEKAAVDNFETKGEKCLRSKKKSNKVVSAHRMAVRPKGKGPKDVVDSAAEWHSESKQVYEELTSRMQGRQYESEGGKAMERAYEKVLKMDLDAKMEIMLSDSPTMHEHVSLSPAIAHYRRKKMRRDMALDKVHIFLGLDPTTGRAKRAGGDIRNRLKDAEHKILQQLHNQKKMLQPIAETRDKFFKAYNSTRKSNEEDHTKFREIYQGDDIPQDTLANSKFVEECLKRGIPAEPLVFHRLEGNTTLRLTNFSMGDDLGAAFASSLPHLPEMHALDLTDNRLTEKSMTLIIEALACTHGGKDAAGSLIEGGGKGSDGIVTNHHPLQSLNLSCNKLDGKCLIGLQQMIVASHGPVRKTNFLTDLCLSRTQISDSSIPHLACAIDEGKTLKRLDLSNNHITSAGGVEFAKVVEVAYCSITDLDLSWNYIARQGAAAMGKALATNESLVTLNLAHNQFGSHGQQIAASLFVNKTLLNLDMSHNSLNGHVGMVLGNCLYTNTTLQHLKLEGNALGQSGGRAIVKAVTACVCQCTLELKGCSFMEDYIFDRNRPSSFSPYQLDMEQPYQRTIMHELCTIMAQRPGCKMVEATYTPAPEVVGEEGKQKLKPQRTRTTKIECDEGSKKVTEGGSAFKLPDDGVYAFKFIEKFHLPKRSEHVGNEGLANLIRLIKKTPTLVERRELLTIACQDMLLLCSQAQFLVDMLQQRQSQKFEDKHRERQLAMLREKASTTRRMSLTDFNSLSMAKESHGLNPVGARAQNPPKPSEGRGDMGALHDKLQSERVEVMQATDVIERVFSKIIDQENLFDFIHKNLDCHQVHELIITSGVQTYKFNSSNPTGHWRFDLLNTRDQTVLLSLAAVNEKQHHESKTDISGRKDTSQHGNWDNFRNTFFNKEPVVLTDAWINEMPKV